MLPALEPEELLVEVGVVGRVGHEDLARDVGALEVAVELFEQSTDELGTTDVLHLVDHQTLAAHDPPLPDHEDLHRRLERVLDHADGVVVLLLGVHHLLPLDRLAHGDDLVAEAGRPLELQLVAGLVHLLVETVEDGRRLAVEEVDELGDERHVLVGGDRAHAGCHALLDVRVQARTPEPGVAVELVLGARADREGAQEEVEGLPDRVGVGVRAEVADTLALRPPHHHRPGPLLVEGDGEVGVGLVVLQPDVEARAVLLDQVEFEEEGLDLVADGDPLHRVGGAHHLHRSLRQAAREVRHHPAAQALRLPHVDDAAGGILELVRAR